MRKFWIVMYAESPQSAIRNVRHETHEDAAAYAAKKAAEHNVITVVLEAMEAVTPVRTPTVTTEVLA